MQTPQPLIANLCGTGRAEPTASGKKRGTGSKKEEGFATCTLQRLLLFYKRRGYYRKISLIAICYPKKNSTFARGKQGFP